MPFRAPFRLVTRVAAVLLEEEDRVPGFFGEIFFAIVLTPFASSSSARTWAKDAPPARPRL